MKPVKNTPSGRKRLIVSTLVENRIPSVCRGVVRVQTMAKYQLVAAKSANNGVAK